MFSSLKQHSFVKFNTWLLGFFLCFKRSSCCGRSSALLSVLSKTEIWSGRGGRGGGGGSEGGRGCVLLIVWKGGGHIGRERESKRREGERNSVLFKWGSKAHRGKGTKSEKQKKVESGLIYARKKLRHSLRKTRAIELKKHWIFFF